MTQCYKKCHFDLSLQETSYKFKQKMHGTLVH